MYNYAQQDDFMAQAVNDLGDDVDKFMGQLIEAFHCVMQAYNLTVIIPHSYKSCLICRYLALSNCHMNVSYILH